MSDYFLFISGFPIAGATFTQDGFLLQKVAASNVGTLGLVLVLLVRLYSGWGYAGARLQSKVIEYEGTWLQFIDLRVLPILIQIFSNSFLCLSQFDQKLAGMCIIFL